MSVVRELGLNLLYGIGGMVALVVALMLVGCVMSAMFKGDFEKTEWPHVVGYIIIIGGVLTLMGWFLRSPVIGAA